PVGLVMGALEGGREMLNGRIRRIVLVARRGSVRVVVLLGAVLAVCVGVAGAAPFALVTEFSDGLNQSARLVQVLETGPDGNVWFMETAPSAIGMLDPATGAVSEFSIPGHGGNPGSVPNTGIVAGPDGNVWFTDNGSPKAIGMIDTVTHAVSEFST